ncbi:uncharacterized protein MONOS_819 [Monocercomonoides exilis]|uniref:uncharacterized protein n=1 Tax=Monocercomonoides exilis TaxID=2049356 RepID=UPI003559EFC6|nr:hypothetical protein MONOS_819 [Monocercomonoides exilis]|eukprot:MONOS_819.1-p1 / transcript=MONOS_819.1 / gene=MONOS_819 / organism=Monocercomonoides_exilis_PA203 / gene_product=unspecified product / transcript_product=unspecified product / location=Mono_scaffold00013:200011-200349(-) / protein_length=113 / sequence_SO=supercontig / SO=protein_coding / is_pseudo=false
MPMRWQHHALRQERGPLRMVAGEYVNQKISFLREQHTLRRYVVARKGVLYGGVVCAYDVALSAMLSVPLVAPLPSLAASVGTKSGSKRIFAAADVNAFPSICDLFDPSLQIW